MDDTFMHKDNGVNGQLFRGVRLHNMTICATYDDKKTKNYCSVFCPVFLLYSTTNYTLHTNHFQNLDDACVLPH